MGYGIPIPNLVHRSHRYRNQKSGWNDHRNNRWETDIFSPISNFVHSPTIYKFHNLSNFPQKWQPYTICTSTISHNLQTGKWVANTASYAKLCEKASNGEQKPIGNFGMGKTEEGGDISGAEKFRNRKTQKRSQTPHKTNTNDLQHIQGGKKSMLVHP